MSDISERTLVREKTQATVEYRLGQAEERIEKHEDRLDKIEDKVKQAIAYATGAAAVVGVLWTVFEKLA